jgi:hypothetical protein
MAHELCTALPTRRKLVSNSPLNDIDRMTKHSKTATTRRAAAKNGSKSRGARNEVVGVTSDGVRILRGAVRPTHFTSREIREAIRAVVGDRKG